MHRSFFVLLYVAAAGRVAVKDLPEVNILRSKRTFVFAIPAPGILVALIHFFTPAVIYCHDKLRYIDCYRCEIFIDIIPVGSKGRWDKETAIVLPVCDPD